ncbi:MAG: hypothetical protein IKC27_06130, partial [Kiritimatiellae bacterium]|nr:hypothetical protein [Kiritimatiellia bacterium]
KNAPFRGQQQPVVSKANRKFPTWPRVAEALYQNPAYRWKKMSSLLKSATIKATRRQKSNSTNPIEQNLSAIRRFTFRKLVYFWT